MYVSDGSGTVQLKNWTWKKPTILWKIKYVIQINRSISIFYFNTTVILYSFQIVWIKKAQLNDFLCISCGRIFQKLIQLNNSLFKSLIRHIDRIFFLQKTNRIDRKRCSSTIYSTCMFQGSHPANFVKKKICKPGGKCL